MSRYIPLSSSRHRGLGYAANGYGFALQMPCVPLVLDELKSALASMPIAFVAADDGHGFRLVGLQSLEADRNVYVHLDGRWITGYRPAWYRAYPFHLAPHPETDERVLCIDERAQGLCDDPDEQALHFFDDEGGVTERLQQVMSFLESLEASRQKTAAAVAALARHGVIVPWEWPAAEGSGGGRPLAGLYRIDEAALRALPGEALAELAVSGGLMLAHAQLFSEGRISVVENLHRLRGKHEQAAADTREKSFFDEDDEFVFDF